MPSHETSSEGSWDLNKLGFGLSRDFLNFGADLSDAGRPYLQGNASAYSKRVSAAGLEDQAKMHMFNAGEIQRQGWDRAALRYDELRREISRQRVTAAGSGIDLSSRTVSRAETSSRVGARWDVDQYSRTAQAKSFAEVRNAMNARINSAYARAEAKFAKAAGNAGTINGVIGALGRAAGGIAGSIGMSYNPGAAGYTMTEDQVYQLEAAPTDMSGRNATQAMNGWGGYGGGQVRT